MSHVAMSLLVFHEPAVQFVDDPMMRHSTVRLDGGEPRSRSDTLASMWIISDMVTADVESCSVQVELSTSNSQVWSD